VLDLLTSIANYWYYVWYELAGASVVKLILLFWPCFMLDIPRYVITDFIVFLIEFPKRLLYGIPEPLKLSPQDAPLVSVIIPAHNEEDTIAYTIRSILETKYPKLDIIVIDDGSTDRTYEVASAFVGKAPVRVFRKTTRSGKSAAANYALQFVRGDFILITDSDTSFDRDAIVRILEPMLRDERVGAVSGNLRVRNADENLLTTLQAAEYMMCISVARRWLSLVNILTIVSGAFGCFRRELLIDSGGWDVGPGEDADLTVKVRKLGVRVAFAPYAIAMTNVPTTWRAWVRQRLRWTRSFIRLRLRKHGDVLNPFIFYPSNAVAVIIGFIFEILLLFSFFVYLIIMLAFYRSILPMVFTLTIILYSISNFIQLFFAVALSERPVQDARLLLYAPLIVFYRMAFRLVRAVAHLQEFFRLPYKETYVPEHVRRAAPHW